MLFSGIDLHKRSLVIHTLDADGATTSEAELRSDHAAVMAYFGTLDGPHRAVVDATLKSRLLPRPTCSAWCGRPGSGSSGRIPWCSRSMTCSDSRPLGTFTPAVAWTERAPPRPGPTQRPSPSRSTSSRQRVEQI